MVRYGDPPTENPPIEAMIDVHRVQHQGAIRGLAHAQRAVNYDHLETGFMTSHAVRKKCRTYFRHEQSNKCSRSFQEQVRHLFSELAAEAGDDFIELFRILDMRLVSGISEHMQL